MCHLYTRQSYSVGENSVHVSQYGSSKTSYGWAGNQLGQGKLSVVLCGPSVGHLLSLHSTSAARAIKGAIIRVVRVRTGSGGQHVSS